MTNLVGRFLIDVKVPTLKYLSCIYKIIPKTVILIDLNPIYIITDVNDDYEFHQIYIMQDKLSEYLSNEEEKKSIEDCKIIFENVIKSFDMIDIGVTKLPYWQLLHHNYNELPHDIKQQVSPVFLPDGCIRTESQKVIYLFSLNNLNSCIVFHITETEEKISEVNNNLIQIEGKDTMPMNKNSLIGIIDVTKLATYNFLSEDGNININNYHVRNSPFSLVNFDIYKISLGYPFNMLKTIRNKLLEIFDHNITGKENHISNYIREEIPDYIYAFIPYIDEKTGEQDNMFLSIPINTEL